MTSVEYILVDVWKVGGWTECILWHQDVLTAKVVYPCVPPIGDLWYIRVRLRHLKRNIVNGPPGC